jgi:hypothetical protein
MDNSILSPIATADGVCCVIDLALDDADVLEQQLQLRATPIATTWYVDSDSVTDIE